MWNSRREGKGGEEREGRGGRGGEGRGGGEEGEEGELGGYILCHYGLSDVQLGNVDLHIGQLMCMCEDGTTAIIYTLQFSEAWPL